MNRRTTTNPSTFAAFRFYKTTSRFKAIETWEFWVNINPSKAHQLSPAQPYETFGPSPNLNSIIIDTIEKNF